MSEKIATKKEEYKIYSIDQGRKIGSEGGIKRIIVRGVVGTPFKILVSNSSNHTYNVKTGVFEAGGGMIEGVIPKGLSRSHYGETKISVKIPRTTTTETITVRLIDDTPVDHTLIESPADAEKAINTTSGGAQVTKSNAIATLSFLVTATNDGTRWDGKEVTIEGGTTTNDIAIGPGNAEVLAFEEPGTYNFAFSVLADPTDALDFIKIDRQPLFECQPVVLITLLLGIVEVLKLTLRQALVLVFQVIGTLVVMLH